MYVTQPPKPKPNHL